MTVKAINSRQNQRYKSLLALATDPREIRRQGRALLDGPHLLAALIAHGRRPETVLVSDAGREHPEVRALLGRLPEVETLQFPDPMFRPLSGVAAPVGIAAVMSLPTLPAALPTGGCVVLDSIQDAGNVGAILRTAAAAGITDIVLGPGCAGAWTPRVLRAAQGAHFGLSLFEQIGLEDFVAGTPATVVATVAAAGRPLYELDLRGDLVWIFGNEGAGVTDALVAAADLCATIPLAARSESLNVAAAAAVCLFEGLRQQRFLSGRTPCAKR